MCLRVQPTKWLSTRNSCAELLPRCLTPFCVLVAPNLLPTHTYTQHIYLQQEQRYIRVHIAQHNTNTLKTHDFIAKGIECIYIYIYADEHTPIWAVKMLERSKKKKTLKICVRVFRLFPSLAVILIPYWRECDVTGMRIASVASLKRN